MTAVQGFHEPFAPEAGERLAHVPCVDRQSQGHGLGGEPLAGGALQERVEHPIRAPADGTGQDGEVDDVGKPHAGAGRASRRTGR